MAERIGDYMKLHGVKFIRGSVPTNIVLGENGKKKVTWKLGNEEHSDEFDTILLAIGRTADTKNMGLE